MCVIHEYNGLSNMVQLRQCSGHYNVTQQLRGDRTIYSQNYADYDHAIACFQQAVSDILVDSLRTVRRRTLAA